MANRSTGPSTGLGGLAQQVMLASLEAAADGIVITDRGGIIQWVNRAFTRLTGYSSEEAIGQNPRILKSGQHPPDWYDRIWRELLNGKTWEGFLVNRRKDGTLYEEHQSINPIVDESGNITHFVGIKRDWTEQRRIERELARREQEYRLLFEDAPVACLRIDTEGRIKAVNRVLLETTGYEERELIGELFWVLIDESEREVSRKAGMNRLGGRLSAGTVRRPVVRKDGRKIIVDIHQRVIRGTDGQILGLQCTVLDVTDEVKSHEQLRHQQEQLELVLEGANDAFWDLDIVLGRTRSSRRFAEMLGIPPEAIPADGASWRQQVHPDDTSRVMATWAAHLGGVAPHFQCEFRVRAGDGSWRWIQSRGKVVKRDESGRPIRATGVFSDVTELRSAEHARQKTEQQFGTLVESLAEGIVVRDRNGRMLFCNNSAERILGMPADALISPEFSYDWQALSEDGTPFPVEQHPTRVAVTTGRSVPAVVMGIHRPDGSLVWLSVNSEPLFTPGESEPYAAVGSFTDITHTRRMMTELQVAKAAAESAARAKSEFLATMSHEIRTPMNGIIGMTGLLLDTQLTEEQLGFADSIRESADALLSLINEILDFSKIEAGRVNIERQPFDVREGISSVVDLLRPWAVQKGLEVRLDFAPAVPETLMGDLGRIRQVVMNLVGNAVKFTQRGFVSITVDYRPNGRFAVAVSDTGIGIAPDELPRLFNKFYQVDFSSARKYSGTGLGLAICKQLIELMGGTISVRSRMGAGSTFEFTVPLEPPPPCPLRARIPVGARETVSPAPAPDSFNGVRVLLVEDNLVNQRVAQALLKKFGCRVDIAANGMEAVTMVSKFPFAAVLMDCQMPEMDGFEATRSIRRFENGSGRRIPIIAMTASAMESDRLHCLEVGMDDYISKPVKPHLLAEVLRKWVGTQPLTALE